MKEFASNKLSWINSLPDIKNDDLLRQIHAYKQDCLIILRRVKIIDEKYLIVPRLEIKNVNEQYKSLRFQKTPQIINILNQIKEL